jgi:hypothetical protein
MFPNSGSRYNCTVVPTNFFYALILLVQEFLFNLHAEEGVLSKRYEPKRSLLLQRVV